MYVCVELTGKVSTLVRGRSFLYFGAESLKAKAKFLPLQGHPTEPTHSTQACAF